MLDLIRFHVCSDAQTMMPVHTHLTCTVHSRETRQALTWHRVRRMWTAQTEDTTRVSTVGQPLATEAEDLAAGGATLAAGTRNCRLRASATKVLRSACSTSVSLSSTARCKQLGQSLEG